MSTIAYDFLEDANGDLLIDPVAMDFVFGPSDNQHVADILQSVPGWFKDAPLVGFNPYQYINGKTEPSAVTQNATIQLQGDGYLKGPGGINVTVDSNGNVIVNALDIYRP